MSKRMIVNGSMAAAVFAFLLTASLSVADEDGDKLKGVKCPVSGKPAVEDKTVAYKEGEVYFCCPGCPGAFKKDTAKFATKANHQLAQTGQYEEAKCPLSGRGLNEDTVVEVAGVEVTFCCPNCQGKVADAEGDAQLEMVFSDKAFAKAFKPVKKDQ